MFVFTGRAPRCSGAPAHFIVGYGRHKPLLQQCAPLAFGPTSILALFLVNHSVKRAYTVTLVLLRTPRVCSHPDGGGSRVVDEDVVFLKFLDVSLDLVHLGLEDLLARHLADRVELAVMALLLVVTHENLPLLLKGGDELLALLFTHELPLLIAVVLLLDLHLTNEVVLILDFLFDLSDILGHSAVGLLLKHVLLPWCG